MLNAILFCFFIILLPTTINAETLNYTNQQYHYSFSIPNGWVEIPKSTINEVMQRAVNITGGRFVDYVAGFQLKNTQIFQSPYILIQQHKVNTPSYNQITQTITQTFESNKFSKNLKEYSELITNATFNDPFVDQERNILFVNSEADIANVGKVKGLTAMFLGKNGITQLNCYSVKSEFSKNLPTFNQIIDSFRYEQGYMYDGKEAKRDNPISISDEMLGKSIGSAIVGFFIALLIGKFLKKDKSKNENNTSKNPPNDELTNIHEKNIYEEVKNNENNYNKNALEKIIVEKLKQINSEEWQIHYAKNRIMNAIEKSNKPK